MSEKEESGEVCEVCRDDTFVKTFCSAIGGDKECIELTERAGRGEITQEQYYARVIEKYGRDKVAMAMEKALVKDKMDIKSAASVGAKAEVKQPEASVQAPGPQAQQPKEQAKGKISKEEEKLATGMADDKEMKEMEERAKAGLPKFKTSQKGLCLPCIGNSISAIITTISLWYAGAQKGKIEDLVKQMQAGGTNVEDALAEVLTLSGGKDCLNSVLNDMNKTIELSTDLALKMKPELAEKKKKG